MVNNMKINKNSWFHKFIREYGMSVWDEHALDNGKMSLCTYSKCFLKALVSSLFMVLFLLFIAGVICAIFLQAIIFPIGFLYFGYTFGDEDPIKSLKLSLSMLTVFTIFGIAYYINRFRSYKKLNNITIIPKNEVTNFFGSWYKSVKNKYCPIIEVTNDNSK